MPSAPNDVRPSARFDLEMKRILGSAPVVGRWELSFLASKLYGRPSPGPVETAEILVRKPTLVSALIRVANVVHHGAGIAATNIQAATIRLGTQRTQSLAITKQIECVLAESIGDAADLGAFWRGSLARAALARAIAMNSHRAIAGEAFLVGLLQDIGLPLLARAYGRQYASLLARSDGRMNRLAILEWQSLNLTHIHVARRLLEAWDLPACLLEAVGRHHTPAPVDQSTDPALALWQIGHFTGAVPLACTPRRAAFEAPLSEFLSTAFGIPASRQGDLIRQAAEEYVDVAGLFDRQPTDFKTTQSLFFPAAQILGAVESPPRDTPSLPARRIHEGDRSLARRTSSLTI